MTGITEAQLNAEKRRLKRLVISSSDFCHAKRYAELIMARNWTDSDYLLHALNTALVVAYWRPFSNNDPKAKASDTLPSLGSKYRKTFTQAEQKLHERIKDLRNAVMAHSGSDPYNVCVRVDDIVGGRIAIPIARNPHAAALTRDDVQALLGMIRKLTVSMTNDQIRLQKLLPAGTQF